MGLLAEARSRKSISRDPNNTKWSRNANTFGHRILRAQGWQPGQCLGDQKAAHSQLHTAANASGIRISIKDDIKGLGFNKSREDEITGLDIFSDLLSRLNGKSTDSIAEEREARLIMKTNAYLESRWGPVRFVKGGFLVSEKKEEEGNTTDTCEMRKEDDAKVNARKHASMGTTKKRKASSLGEDVTGSDIKRREKRCKERNVLTRKESSSASPATCGPQVSSKESLEPRDDKKSKRLGKRKKNRSSCNEGTESRSERNAIADNGTKANLEEGGANDGKDSSPQEAATVVAVKERTKANQDGKKGKKRTQKSGLAAEDEQMRRADGNASTDAKANLDASTSSGASTGTSTPTNGRNLVRSRFIAAKRQAMLDPSALKQIFMIAT